jgi:hypothetical protein
MWKVATAAAIAVAALAFLGVPGRAAGAEKAQCKVLTIHATNKEGTTDPRLEEIPELSKPPFNLYKTFHLLSEKDYTLKKDVPVTLSLPAASGLVGKLVFKGENKALKELDFKLYLIKGSGKDKKEEETSFAVKGAAPFFYVRPFKDGQLILYIKCGSSPPPKKSEKK